MRLKKITAVITIGIFLALLIWGGGHSAYYLIKFPDVSPAPDIKIKASEELIEKGRYLSNHVYVCFECHTPRNWDYFSGPPIAEKHGMGGELLSKQHHEGLFYTSNITPAALENWSDGEIMRAINVGVRYNDKPLHWGMPSFKYSTMPVEDLKAIVAYLRTIKPIENNVPASKPDWSLWKDIRTWQEDPNPQPAPDKTDKIAYGSYLMEAASCKGCHTHTGTDKNIKPELGLSGGYPFNVRERKDIVRSANITPDKETGIGNWTKETFIERFRFFGTEKGKTISAVDGEFQTPMPWAFYSDMSDEDLGAIYEYIQTLKPIKNRVQLFTPHEQ